MAVGLLAVACGYRLRGTGSYLPSHIKKVSVPLFRNMTTRYELDVRLTQSVINELISRAKIEIVAEKAKAEAVLLGEITTFSVNPIGFSGKVSADRYSITIVAKIVLRDLVHSKALFSNPSLTFMKEYEVPQGADFESLETEAVGKVADEFARTVVINILEGF